MGTIVMGKLQSGMMRVGQRLVMMPNKNKVVVDTIYKDDEESPRAQSGDNVKVKLKNIEEEEISPGYVLCAKDSLCSTGMYMAVFFFVFLLSCQPPPPPPQRLGV